jgi:hypothetical protein
MVGTSKVTVFGAAKAVRLVKASKDNKAIFFIIFSSNV